MSRCVATLFFLFLLTSIGRAQDAAAVDDPLQAKVAKARKVHAEKNKKIAAELEKRLKTKEDRALRKGDKKLYDRISAEHKALSDSGAWPTLAETKDLKKQSEAARREFVAVLKTAVADCTRQKQLEKAAEFQKELDTLLDPAAAAGEDPRESAGTGVLWRIVSRHSGKVLDVADGSTKVGARVVQYAVGERPSQLWEALPATNPSGSIVLRNHASGHFLHLPGGSRNSGTGVILYTTENHKGPGECWSLKRDGDWFTLSVTVSGMQLDVFNNSKDDGGEIVQWPSTNTPNQQWKFVRAETGRRKP